MLQALPSSSIHTIRMPLTPAPFSLTHERLPRSSAPAPPSWTARAGTRSTPKRSRGGFKTT